MMRWSDVENRGQMKTLENFIGRRLEPEVASIWPATSTPAPVAGCIIQPWHPLLSIPSIMSESSRKTCAGDQCRQ